MAALSAVTSPRSAKSATESAANADTATTPVMSSNRVRIVIPKIPLEFHQRPGAVADALLLNPGLVQDRQQQVRHGRALRVLQMPAALELSSSAARDKHRQR